MRMRARLAAGVMAISAVFAGAASAAAEPTVYGQADPFSDDILDDVLRNPFAAADIDIDILNSGQLCGTSVAVLAVGIPGAFSSEGETVCITVDFEDEDD